MYKRISSEIKETPDTLVGYPSGGWNYQLTASVSVIRVGRRVGRPTWKRSCKSLADRGMMLQQILLCKPQLMFDEI